MPAVIPATRPRPEPPGQGRDKLITKDEAINIYHKACIDYVNEKIEHSCKNKITTVDLETEYLYDELLEKLTKEYEVLCSTGNCTTFRIV
ncbi:hypothetical protein [Clostridium sporogenes]|uniref:Uncharacterized protein n=1 Tax=Clostridium sporogenes TaxID=1509 RepID=A0ABX4K2U6_CLOSG|nr:hypothetical protein [Clostridium sporogenes]PHG98894.1 hypothetical protein CRX47_03185 [Clostridium sporogenes]UBI13456.1 hypothetical protein LA336_07995 [Clostridium sporogenes]